MRRPYCFPTCLTQDVLLGQKVSLLSPIDGVHAVVPYGTVGSRGKSVKVTCMSILRPKPCSQINQPGAGSFGDEDPPPIGPLERTRRIQTVSLLSLNKVEGKSRDCECPRRGHAKVKTVTPSSLRCRNPIFTIRAKAADCEPISAPATCSTVACVARPIKT